ncbi:MAG: NAD(P)/FAD-dependent oxidoreductase [Promethearchaeota archaeon]|nr:MAG: NAD(P)/FAD-dependent oxidoreductase [Candidatus Lokiarchaeota archaeon]
MYDVIVIGAGVGGLSCAAQLASLRKKVLIVEKIHHIGGTSHIFTRKKEGTYFFPMGPLSFSHPEFVNLMLKDMGIKSTIDFKRSHFQLITPEIDIIYSKQWEDFQKDLKDRFPQNAEGIEKLFGILKEIIAAIKQIQDWHPEFTLLSDMKLGRKEIPEQYAKKLKIVEKYSEIPSKIVLDKYLANPTLKKLLGSQGTYEPVMNMIHLAFMWNLMSIEGIWYPSIGIHGINDELSESIRRMNGDILLNSSVEEILVEDQKAFGVLLSNGKTYKAPWIVSNADYKTTFLELIKPENVPVDHLQKVQNSAYTGSEICVYLSADKNNVDLSKLRADHLFYRHNMRFPSQNDKNIFDTKEIEICQWSKKEPHSAPEGKISLILRANMNFNTFSEWRTGIKKRKEGYDEYKRQLGYQLIKVVDNIIPGLLNSHDILDIATPLTYLDWGKRYKGSIAGWSRDLEKLEDFDKKILIKTPIDHLLVVGIYSFIEPFLGGYPVSMYSGKLAAEFIDRYWD